MDDPNFHFGTMYYMSIQNMDDDLRATNLKVTVKQLKAVEKIPNGVPKKFQYVSDRELVKNMVFQVPTDLSNRAKTFIQVEALTEHVYPSIYLSQLEFDSDVEDVEKLFYPSIFFYDQKFGTNPYALLNNKVVSVQFQSIYFNKDFMSFNYI